MPRYGWPGNPSGSPSRSSFGGLEVIGYGATTVLNALLTRNGGKPGVLITRGFEDLLTMERGKQSWVTLSRVDRIHPVTHRHQPPLVPRARVRGVGERINSVGEEMIPLREQTCSTGSTSSLSGRSGLNRRGLPLVVLERQHERRTKEILEAELARRGCPDIPVFISSEISPDPA